MKRVEIVSAVAVACLAIMLGSTWAMANGGGGGSGGSGGGGSEQQASAYKEAKKAIDAERYTQAIAILQKMVREQGAYADVLNLLGYSYRKSGDPKDALDYYNQALAMEPKHLGANEYMGELYLEMKMPDKAKERLAVLKDACGDCDEYQELAAKIGQYSMN